MIENWEQYKDLEYYPDRVCKCGCGGRIKVRTYHKRYGIPEFISGHNTIMNPPMKNPEAARKNAVAQRGKPRPSMVGDKSPTKRPEVREKIRAASKKRWAKSEERAKASANVSGDKNPGWRGGTSIKVYPFEFNDEFREFVRERYDYTCMLCKLTQEQVGHTLRVHHIDYDKDNLEPDDFVSLCLRCHGATGSGDRGYWTKVLQKIVEMNKSLVPICI